MRVLTVIHVRDSAADAVPLPHSHSERGSRHCIPSLTPAHPLAHLPTESHVTQARADPSLTQAHIITHTLTTVHTHTHAHAHVLGLPDQAPSAQGLASSEGVLPQPIKFLIAAPPSTLQAWSFLGPVQKGPVLGFLYSSTTRELPSTQWAPIFA